MNSLKPNAKHLEPGSYQAGEAVRVVTCGENVANTHQLRVEPGRKYLARGDIYFQNGEG